jgi:hypothetical protein
MNITLFPQRSNAALSISKSGDVLNINGYIYDFSVIPEGASLPASAVDCPFLVGDISRTDGFLHLGLIAPHGVNPSNTAAFPSPLINPADGALELPQ